LSRSYRAADYNLKTLFFYLLAPAAIHSTRILPLTITGNMKLIALIVSLIFKRKSRPSPFSEAVSEGIKEAFKEMGYRLNENDNKI